ncbi:sulfotransferase domain-containing protein [Psychroserpens sp. XS_ASV72]|uniref:sulfotransferase domain-containing protein n=1 Tax=Psychroserpens sp. XS_ASV72 TaxID=3241293 RepID=UPI0035154B53
MISNAKTEVRKFLENRKIGRNIDVIESDVYLVSYPKSGNTWLRFLIGNIISDDFNFTNMNSLIPDIYKIRNKDLKKFESPRILKSHEYFDPRYKKVVYIVRDPRSVCVSYYEYLKKMNKIKDNLSMDVFVDNYIKGNYDPYGSWKENVGSWMGSCKDSDKFLLVRYEDLKEDTSKHLRNILNFMNIDYTEEKLSCAIEKSSFKKMRANEIENKKQIKALKNSRQNMHFVRKGETNEWMKTLSQENQNKICEAFESTLKDLGYI